MIFWGTNTFYAPVDTGDQDRDTALSLDSTVTCSPEMFRLGRPVASWRTKAPFQGL